MFSLSLFVHLIFILAIFSYAESTYFFLPFGFRRNFLEGKSGVSPPSPPIFFCVPMEVFKRER